MPLFLEIKPELPVKLANRFCSIDLQGRVKVRINYVSFKILNFIFFFIKFDCFFTQIKVKNNKLGRYFVYTYMYICIYAYMQMHIAQTLIDSLRDIIIFSQLLLFNEVVVVRT